MQQFSQIALQHYLAIGAIMFALGLVGFQLKYSVGALPHEQRLESVRLYGEEVVPRVRELLAGS